MCGAENAFLKADIEGIQMTVCKACAKFGKVISGDRRSRRDTKFHIRQKARNPYSEEEMQLSIVDNYGDIIKQKREKIGLSQEDFAKQINEKVSIIGKVENNLFEPSIGLAKKIERFLNISLIEKGQAKTEVKQAANKSNTLTIGDLIEIKQK